VKRDNRSTRRGDRIALALLGALLLAGAVLVLLVATGAIDSLGSYVDGDESLLNAQLDATLQDHQLAWQLGTTAVGVLLLVLGLVWLRHQLPTRRQLHDTPLAVADHTPGNTIVDGRALANAFEGDIRRHPDVLDARADMLLDQGIVRVRLTAADDVDVERLVRDAVHPAVTRLTTVADLATPPTPQIDLRLRPRTGRALQ
jgi:hypothetical protein